MDIICGFLTLAQQWNNANTFYSANSWEVGFKQHQDWWPVTQRDLGGEVLNLRRSSLEFADSWTCGKYFLKIDAEVLDVSKCFQIFRAYSSWTKPKWCSASGCRELIGKGGEGGGSQGEGNIHKNYSHHNHQLHDNHHHHHDNHHHYHDNHHHHRHSTTVPSSKVPPRLAGCPSVTLRGTSYQCRSFMKL